jgi:hypothetical protein
VSTPLTTRLRVAAVGLWAIGALLGILDGAGMPAWLSLASAGLFGTATLMEGRK